MRKVYFDGIEKEASLFQLAQITSLFPLKWALLCQSADLTQNLDQCQTSEG